MDIYSIGEERCIDGTWGRMVGKRFYTQYRFAYDNTHQLLRKLDTDTPERDGQTWRASLLLEGGKYIEQIVNFMTIFDYKPKPIEYKRGDIVWVFDDNKWQPVYYWGENPISVGGFVCIKSFTADGKAKMGDFILTSEVYSKLPIEIQ